MVLLLIFQDKLFYLSVELNPGLLAFQTSVQTVKEPRVKLKGRLKCLLHVCVILSVPFGSSALTAIYVKLVNYIVITDFSIAFKAMKIKYASEYTNSNNFQEVYNSDVL